MPLDLHVIRATDFIRVDPQGHFDLSASKAALALLVGACRKRGIDRALMDLRALHPGPEPVFTPADLAELVNTFPEVGFTQQQYLAILYQSDPHKRARLFAFLSTLHGWNVRAFGDFEEALSWLSSSQETSSEPQPSPSEKRISIRFNKPKVAPPHRRHVSVPRNPRNEPAREKVTSQQSTTRSHRSGRGVQKP